MLKVTKINKTFNAGTVNEKLALSGVDLQFNEGEYITMIGGNGAGKSTLLNCVAGVYPVDSGNIFIDNTDVTNLPEHKRARLLGRVFQDPMMGTAANMGIEENLALAYRRGQKRGIKWGITSRERGILQAAFKNAWIGTGGPSKHQGRPSLRWSKAGAYPADGNDEKTAPAPA